MIKAFRLVRKWLTASLLASIVLTACAPATATASSAVHLDYGGWSYHFDRSYPWNESHNSWGLSLESHEAFRFDGIAVTHFTNSYNDPSTALSVSSGLCWYGVMTVCGAGLMGGATGYEDTVGMAVMPFAGFEVSSTYKRLGFKFQYMPGYLLTIQGRILLWQKD